MATVYSTQRTNALANPVVNNKTNEIGGRVRIAHGVYEASSLASGDVIEMFKLPNGARIISGSLAHDALGSSTTLSVGHAAYTQQRWHCGRGRRGRVQGGSGIDICTEGRYRSNPGARLGH